jgi:hypothetical protein
MVFVRVLEESQNSLHVKVPEHEIRDLMNHPLAKFLQLGIQKLNMRCLSFIKISITLSACASYPMVKVVKCYLFVDHGHHLP